MGSTSDLTMTNPEIFTEIWRGDLLESFHCGHAVVCDEKGEIVHAWGDPTALIYPRSSSKMMQALPMIEGGFGDHLTSEQLALCCASHNGGRIHVDRVRAWLADMGLSDDDLRCGAHMPYDPETSAELICGHTSPDQCHNNCSGKHAGFLTFTKALNAGPEYLEIDHPVQLAIRQAHDELTEETSPVFGIDGCSAPNFAASLHGFARAMATFASARDKSGARHAAMDRLIRAMTAHPELVAGEGRSCTELMRAMDGRVAIKTGAEAVFFAMIPEKKLGVALKIVDGTTRASECAIAAILVKLGVLDPAHDVTRRYLDAPLTNRRGFEVGTIRAGVALR